MNKLTVSDEEVNVLSGMVSKFIDQCGGFIDHLSGIKNDMNRALIGASSAKKILSAIDGVGLSEEEKSFATSVFGDPVEAYNETVDQIGKCNHELEKATRERNLMTGFLNRLSELHSNLVLGKDGSDEQLELPMPDESPTVYAN